VKFFKIFIIFILLSSNLYASEKEKIVNQLKNLNSLEFTFDQVINDKTEKGSCLLKFPGKLKCDYFDDKKKELIINNKRLAITQKRYNKTYYYPITKYTILKILY
jgi:outer membrane lipoprotein-sorting protein